MSNHIENIRIGGIAGMCVKKETGQVRTRSAQDNDVRARVPPAAASKHTFKIRAMDPGAVVDRVALP